MKKWLAVTDHTPEYYRHRLDVINKELQSYRDMSRYQIGSAGYATAIEILRAQVEQLQTIADTMFYELKMWSDQETAGMREYKKACCG